MTSPALGPGADVHRALRHWAAGAERSLPLTVRRPMHERQKPRPCSAGAIQSILLEREAQPCSSGRKHAELVTIGAVAGAPAGEVAVAQKQDT